MAFSRDQVRGSSVSGPDGNRLLLEPGRAQHIADEMLRDDNAQRLWDLLLPRTQGGGEACFRVCGSTGSASSVTEAIKAIVERHGAPVHPFLCRLAGTGRFRQEIFTTYTGAVARQPRFFDASEIVDHNDDANGYWMAIDGRVYDLTELAGMHPRRAQDPPLLCRHGCHRRLPPGSPRREPRGRRHPRPVRDRGDPPARLRPGAQRCPVPRWFLHQLTDVLRSGVKLFEDFERDTFWALASTSVV